ncbi:Flagellar biosynthesis protein FlhA [Candidatus Syntrophocurvum alkaliphilum]|uniref:Flagellar biosynthesis protein FlhA n=1 Tax=Candidatus Syntrophocurvum alkaliphilum TaxID=2293317 RepID=A0A6I6D899_9FIRM|nr:flagellar biosynthesis protein FlhA [Candidatus Syntrophocurvum alkaliphilum]QGT99183.1 Flagellar biosynthesis protein FlhA [Candidatus Syntrophocurvum alkaliphilum]
MLSRTSLTDRITDYSDVLIAMIVICVVMMMIVPLRTGILDILITFNITFALIILMVTIFNNDPLDFSVFPALLLIMTLFRLAINVSTTRLILLDADAGQVIEAFGSFVIGGNTVVGLVIFLILVVIQFIVITKGAERASEVAARFTLDAMPGKQMAIDADLNAGLINEEQARERREKIQKEANFYGSMDGASKFVKGDAIAGIVIIIINIVGGLVIGMAQMGMDFSQAAGTYTILTVGDGLVTQIPALLISTATGIVVTRSISETGLGTQLTTQILNFPNTMGIVAVVLFVLGTIGLPTFPMYTLAVLFAIMFFVFRKTEDEIVEEEEPEDIQEAEEVKKAENVMELLQVEKMEMELGYGLIPLVDADQGGDLLDRIVMIRRQCAVELGFVVPPIRIRDNMQLKPNSYSIKLKGMVIASGELILDNYLAIGPDIENDTEITGIDTIEPAFNLPAKWIDTNEKDSAELKGYTVVDPPSVLATHITSVIKSHAFELLGRQEVQGIIDYVKEQNQAVIEELIPDLLSLGEIQKVLGNLLKEQISIRDIITILETLADYSKLTKDTDVLSEYVRQSLKRQISNQYSEDNKISVLTIDPNLEDKLRESVQQSEFGSYLALDPEIAQTMIDNLTAHYQELTSRGVSPIILCAPVLRIYFKRLIDRFMPGLTVLSYNEIDNNIEVEVLGMVSV